MKKEICDLLNISEVSYYRWKKERKIFSLLEKYFSKEDLEEFLKHGVVTKLENNYGLELSTTKHFLLYLNNIIDNTEDLIEYGLEIEETSLLIFIDILNEIRKNSIFDINMLIDDMGDRDVVYGDFLFKYFKNIEFDFDPSTFNILSRYDLVTSAYIFSVLVNKNSKDFYQFGRVYDLKAIYIYHLFELYYYKKLNEDELLELYKQTTRKHMANFLTTSLKTLFIWIS